MSQFDARDRSGDTDPVRHGSGSTMLVLLLIGGGVVILGALAGLVMLGMFLFMARESKPQPQAANGPEPRVVDAIEGPPPPVAGGSRQGMKLEGAIPRPAPKGTGTFAMPPNFPKRPFDPREPATRGPTPIALPALPAALPIQPPSIGDSPVVRELPSTTDGIAVGGGGRFIILRLPSESKLAVFDVNEAKIVKFIPLAESRAHFTAGMDEVVVALPKAHVFQRWSLKTFERQAVSPIPFSGVITGLRMGSASRGPLLACEDTADRFQRSDRVHIVDAATFKEMQIDSGFRPVPGAVAKLVRASGDGRLFAWRPSSGGEPHEMVSLVLEPSGPKVYTKGMGDSLLTPTPDGRFVVGLSGAMAPDFTQVYPRPAATAMAQPYIPAAQGPYLLRLFSREPVGPPNRPDSRPGTIFIVHRSLDFEIARIADVDGVTVAHLAYGSPGLSPLAHDERVMFIPAAKLLVTVPTSNKSLVLRRVDIEAELEKSGKSYLLVTSEPITDAKKGTEYRYAIVAKAKQKEIRYKLDSGPKGMAISKDGVVSWNVPKDFAEKETNIIVTISCDQSTEQFHTFKLLVD